MPKIRLESKIDSGGFGEVLRGTIVEDGRKVAVKRLTKPYSPDDVKRFTREVRIMSQLKHRNIVPVLAYNVDKDPPWFAMPLAKCNLVGILAELRTDEDRRRLVFEQVLSGVDFAHQQGVIHRDLKPQNILMFPGDRVALADFGLGRFLYRDSTTLTLKGDHFGTVFYSAPEQIADFSASDVRSDIYVLGKILYQMLTAKPVFPVPNMSGLDGKYVYVIQKCLEPEPSSRYQTVADLAKDFLLLTQSQYQIEAPLQVAQDILSSAVDPLLGSVVPTAVDRLLKVFHDHTDDEELFIGVFPRLPEEVLSFVLEKRQSSFLILLEYYDNFVSGSLPFEYCDVVANFYQSIYAQVDVFSVKKMAIRRLLTLGHVHNRWHVRAVLGQILGGIEDAGVAKLALDICQSDIPATRWCGEILVPSRLHPILGKGVSDILKTEPPTPTMDEDYIPF